MMRTLVETAAEGRRPGLALALLSGTYSEPEDFVREGFPAAVRSHGIEADIVMAGVSAAHFADGSIVERIRSHVVLPARERGCERIWLVGISLGGLAALSFAARHEDDLDGIVLLAPYPATRDLLREVDAAGGLAQWKSQGRAGEGDLEREAWSWLAGARAHRLPVHCYLASGDRFASGQRRLGEALDERRVHELPGGHDWGSWRRLWQAFLDESKGALQ
jgi:pimeloyl-ACP methyl ester carboxylesterase